MKLFVFGFGYSATHFVARFGARFTAIHGTVRSPEKAGELKRAGVTPLLFDSATGDADPAILPALDAADVILVSVQPTPTGDPALARFGEAVAAAPAWRRLVYLSTIGVYGDHDGRWIDETTPPDPANDRGATRLAVEAAWLALGAPPRRQVAVLRLAGIYGPGRSVVDDLREGSARRIDKPGQVFNRIHVADIAGAIAGAFDSPAAQGVWNVTDDEPAPAPDVVAYGAELLGVEPPPLTPFDTAALSPMARSFYSANRRVANAAVKRDLGLVLLYPTYREGVAALAGKRTDDPT